MNPVLLIAIPLILAFISIFIKRLAPVLLVLGSLFNTISLFLYDRDTQIIEIGGFDQKYGISLLFDQYAFVGLVVVNILFFLLLVVNLKRIKEMAIVLLIALTGLNGLLLTHDLFNLFVFMEISGIAAYILTTQNKKVVHSFHYLVMGTVGSTLYLLGLAMLYGMVGTLNMTVIYNAIGHTITRTDVAIPILLMFIGLGVEVKIMPFSSWVKGILEHATALVGALIASVYAGTMLFVFGRLFTDVFTLTDSLVKVFVIIGMVTLVGGEFAAFSSKKLREILLFSSIAQAGLIVVLFIYNMQALGMIMIVSNVISKFILFTLAGLFTEENQNDDIENLRGLFSQHKLIGLSFSVASLSLIGLPLFYGFVVKLNALYQLILEDKGFIIAIILLTSVVEGAYFIRMLVKLWNAGEEGVYATAKSSIVIRKDVRVTAVVCLLALVIIAFGIIPFNSSLLPNNPNELNPVELIKAWGGLLK